MLQQLFHVGPLLCVRIEQPAPLRGKALAIELVVAGHAPDVGRYAELFENIEAGAIPVGALVGRLGRRVCPAVRGDRLLGVVSGNPSMVGNGAPNGWIVGVATPVTSAVAPKPE